MKITSNNFNYPANSFSKQLKNERPVEDFSSIMKSKEVVNTAKSESVSFSNMTRSQMRTMAQDLYQSGKLDFDSMTNLTMMGPLGKAGPNGEFIEFTPAERQAIDNKPMNYHEEVQSRIARIQSDGRQFDPTSGYQTWLKIQSFLNNF